jgi:hypothetical protein
VDQALDVIQLRVTANSSVTGPALLSPETHGTANMDSLET